MTVQLKETEVQMQRLAQQAIEALDTFLATLEGGTVLPVLLDARESLNSYVQKGAVERNKTLTVKFSPIGGVTLARAGRLFTLDDLDLEPVREAVNTRLREIRKREKAVLRNEAKGK